MMPRLGSLRLRLLAIIGISTVLLTGVTSLWMFFSVRAELTHALDTRLAASARMVAGLLSESTKAGRNGLTAEDRGLSPFIAQTGDSLACEVSLMESGKVVQTLARTADAPPESELPAGFATLTSSGQVWRTYTLIEGNIRIQTADRMSMRGLLMRDIGYTALMPFAVAFIGVIAMIWFGVARGLAPLERIRRIVAARSANDDHPISFPSVPSELRPLTDTIEQLVARMSSAVMRERQFTDAAAHELRTPLAGLKLHLQVMQMALDMQASAVEVGTSMAHAQADAQRMQRVLDQLLRLARVELAPNAAEPVESCDAWQVASEVLHQVRNGGEAGGRVMLKGGVKQGSKVAIPETLLVMALRNLIDNALRHTPGGTPVTLAVSSDADHIVAFLVEDSGPGMTEAQIDNAPRRFWRAQSDSEGSGLGLSIVAAIAQRVHGRLTLTNRSDRSGLRATLHVPASV